MLKKPGLAQRRRLEAQVAELNQLKNPAKDVEEARTHADVEKARMTSEAAQADVDMARAEIDKLKKEVELQATKLHEMEQTLENPRLPSKCQKKRLSKPKERPSPQKRK